ncbi:ATP-binding protein [Lysinibacillus antri]|uniref:ATP-binding protein n=1 Tax=Lysinibacillus antri TaxID=2498145 RepID=A0A432L9T4_9BACI|nr:ATP-binding protein [Lysinibacillus antri]RUL50498.1 ATP-binding protein [Lysinibacillus antri]
MNRCSMEIKTENDVLKAMEHTSEIANKLGCLPNEQILLSLVTEESLVNALEYGEDDLVKMYWACSDKELEICIKQKGKMYKIEKSDQLNYGNRGRGLQLILNIMNEVWLEQEEEDNIALYMKKRLN